MYRHKVLVMILAGGAGKRLMPLTRDRAKPAVPFGGKYRIIDFVLSNFINSGFFQIKVLTQYKSDSLNKHISHGWNLCPQIGQYVDLVPAQMRTDGNWYKGTADAIFQNAHLIGKYERLCVFGGDHIYKMDVNQMLQFHIDHDADLTISANPIPIEIAHEYGIMEVDEDMKLINFVEKPKEKPNHLPGDETKCLASMGNYIFNSKVLLEELILDSKVEDSAHDFGKNIIPNMMKKGKKIFVYNFGTNEFPGMSKGEKGYWKDVGTVDAYWQANMDLLDYNTELKFYNKEWPLRTYNYNLPPAKFTWDRHEHVGMVKNSLVSEGCLISGGTISGCVLSPLVEVQGRTVITDSILMENVIVGKHSKINKAIIDKNVVIPPNTKIGINKDDDIKRGFYVSEGGVTIVAKDSILQANNDPIDEEEEGKK